MAQLDFARVKPRSKAARTRFTKASSMGTICTTSIMEITSGIGSAPRASSPSAGEERLP